MNWKYKLTVAYFLCYFQTPAKSTCSDSVQKTDTYSKGYYTHSFWNGDHYVSPVLLSRIIHSINTTCTVNELPYSYTSEWSCENCPRTLNINKSYLLTITSRAFQGFSKYTIFYLNDLYIYKILPNAFLGQPVKKIYLNNNKLKEISSGIFNALTELEFLDLSGNILDSLSSNCFVGAGKLNTLYLSNNQLSNFSTSVIDPNVQMKLLNLENNRLAEFIVNGYINIETVSISNNQISNLDFCPYIFKVFNASNNLIKELNFANCTKFNYRIIELNLEFNEINKLDAFVFKKAPNLQKLYLNNNNLEQITTGAFYKLNQLLTLDLSYNKLSYFEHGTFDSLTNLDYLNVSYNRIENLNHVLHSLISLTKLYFENNTISFLDAEQISINSPSLKEISFFNNNLSCENLIKINQYFRKKSIEIGDNDIRNVSNVYGMACTKNSLTETPADKNIQILTNNLNNITSVLNDINDQNSQVKSELQKVINHSEQINQNFTNDFHNFIQYYNSSKKQQLESDKFGSQMLTSILNRIDESNRLHSKKENITEIKFDIILNNVTTFFKELSDKKEDITQERFDNMTSIFKEMSDKKEDMTAKRFDNMISIFKEMSDTKENITERRFEIMKNSLNNMTSIFKEISDKKEDITQKRFDNMTSIFKKMSEQHENLKNGFYDFFQEFKNSNIDRKEDSFRNTPEFQKLISSSSNNNNTEEAQIDKILVMLVIICVLIGIIFSSLFVILYKYISIRKFDNKREQLELLYK